MCLQGPHSSAALLSLHGIQNSLKVKGAACDLSSTSTPLHFTDVYRRGRTHLKFSHNSTHSPCFITSKIALGIASSFRSRVAPRFLLLLLLDQMEELLPRAELRQTDLLEVLIVH